MTIRRTRKNLTLDVVQRLKKRQPRTLPVRNPGESLTRKVVLARSGGFCELCGTARAESVHHRRNKGQGGPWSPSNCVALCGDGVRGCHGWVTEHPKDAHDIGFHLEHGEVPSKTSIVSGMHGRVYLDDDGGIRSDPREAS